MELSNRNTILEDPGHSGKPRGLVSPSVYKWLNWFCVSDFGGDTWWDMARFFRKSGFTIVFSDGIKLDQTRWVRVHGTIQSLAIFGPSDAQGEMYFVQFDPCKPLPWGVSVLSDTWHVTCCQKSCCLCCFILLNVVYLTCPAYLGPYLGICCTGDDFQLIFNWSSDSHHRKSSSRMAATRHNTTKMTLQNPETDPNTIFFPLFRCVSSMFLRILLDDQFQFKEMMTKPVLVKNKIPNRTKNRCESSAVPGKEHHVVKFRCFDVTEGPENAIYGEIPGSIGSMICF